MAARTSRIELRADPEREQCIRHAAKLCQKSVSSFVLEAAFEHAEAVILEATSTAVPSAYFDQLWAALDSPPEPNAALRARAASARRVEQR